MFRNFPSLQSILAFRAEFNGIRTLANKNKYKVHAVSENLRTNASCYMAKYYHELSANTHMGNDLGRFEYKVYSQFGEDGIIAEIISRIGAVSHRIVEIGFGNGTECNSLNLIVNFGWKALLIEGNVDYARAAEELFAKRYHITSDQYDVLPKFVDVENVNELIVGACVQGEIDILSIDIDGNDIWILKEINAINPRLIVVEYNSTYGADLSISVPYQKDFVWQRKDPEKLHYYGASVSALTKVARQKGYTLVHGSHAGVNLFFVRSDLMNDSLVEITPRKAYRPNYARIVRKQNVDISKFLEKYTFVEH